MRPEVVAEACLDARGEEQVADPLGMHHLRHHLSSIYLHGYVLGIATTLYYQNIHMPVGRI